MTVVGMDYDDCEPLESDADDLSNETEEELDEYNEYEEVLYEIGDDASCVLASELVLYKVWRTELGGQWFMTWEPMGIYDDEHAFAKVVWFGFRIVKERDDRFSLDMVNINSDIFEDIEILEEIDEMDEPADERTLKKARRAVEKAIRRNPDADIYDGTFGTFWRIAPEDRDLFIEIVSQVIEQES